MIAKEWLEDIKERFAKYQTDYNLNGEDVEWLIQQAEHVQKQESKWMEICDSISNKKERLEYELDVLKSKYQKLEKAADFLLFQIAYARYESLISAKFSGEEELSKILEGNK